MADMRRIKDEFNCPNCGTHIKREVGVFTDQVLRDEIKRLRAEIEEWRKRFPGAGYDGSSVVLSG